MFTVCIIIAHFFRREVIMPHSHGIKNALELVCFAVMVYHLVIFSILVTVAKLCDVQQFMDLVEIQRKPFKSERD